MVPTLPAVIGKSMQLGDEGVEPVTSSVGEQSPTSQSASTMPLQLSSTPLQISSVFGPSEQPSQVIRSSRQRSVSGPSHAESSAKSSSVAPSQSSSRSLQSSARGPTSPSQGP